MNYSVSTTSEPATEPITSAEAKLHCRVEHTADDSIFTRLIAAARLATERYCDRRWITQTVRVTLAAFPTGDGCLQLPVSPVSAVDSLKYYATDGTFTTMPGDDYQTWLQHSPPVVAPAPTEVWPATQTGRIGAVEVNLTCGFGSASSVPDDAKAAMLLAIGYWYANRGDGRDPHGSPESLGLPPAAMRLLDGLASGGYC